MRAVGSGRFVPHHSLSAYALPPHTRLTQQRLLAIQRLPCQRISQPVKVAQNAHQLERLRGKLVNQRAGGLAEQADRFDAHRCCTTQLLNQQLAIGETAHPPVGKAAPDQTQCHVQGLILGLVAGAGWRASRIDPDHRATLAAHQHAQAGHAARHQFAQSTIRLGEQARSEDENDRADDQEGRR